MREDSPGSLIASPRRKPRTVVGLIFPTGSIYLTNRAGISNVPGNVEVGTLRDISSTSQRLFPDQARATIGTLSFTAVDIGAGITAELRAQLAAGRGVRGREVRVFTGDTDDFNDFDQVETYVIDSSVALDGRAYKFRCSDRTREQRVRIFDNKTTRLDATLTEAATTVTAVDTSEFEMVAHSASFTDAPSSTVGYVLIKKTGEVFRYTGKTSTTFTGVTRGRFGTKAEEVVVDAGTATDKRPELIEFIYLELPAPEMDYAIKTGVIKSTAATLPAGWHMGIAETSIDGDSYDNIGTDLYDPADVTDGFPLRFTHLSKTDGKKFVEEQVHLPANTFVQTTTLGKLRLRRLVPLVSDAAPLVTLGAHDVVKTGALKHNAGRVINTVLVRWNFNGQTFTRENLLFNSDSIATHGASALLEIELRGLHVSAHSLATLNRIFDSIIDRYGSPPLEIEVRLSRLHNQIEIADAVRLTLARLKDYTDTDSLDRTFEVQGRSLNWRTGRLSVSLFGSTAQPVPNVGPGSGAILPDSWYSSAGTLLSSLVTISANAMTSSGSISGGADLRTAIYYHAGPLTINAGVTLTIGDNTQLRVMGTLTVNGKIDGAAQGVPGVASTDVIGNTPVSPPAHNQATLLGATRSSGGLLSAANGILPTSGERQFGVNMSAPRLDLSVVSGALVGIPAEIRGTRGVFGTVIHNTVPQTLGVGGDGGAGGAGLMIVARGLAFGASGEIDLSGGDGSSPPAVTDVGGIDLYAGAGAGGAPGALYVVLDGDDIAYPDVAGKFVASIGATPQLGTPGTFGAGVGLSFPTEPGTSYDVGVGSIDMFSAAHQVQYVPGDVELGDSDDELTPPPVSLTVDLADGAGVRLSWTLPPEPRFDHVDLYESIDNDRNNAVLVARGRMSSFTRSSATSITRYYWAQAFKDPGGFSIWEPVSSTAGVSATFGGAVGPAGADGADGFSIVQTNEAHSIPVDNAGVHDYTGSGNTIEVYIDATAIPYDFTVPYQTPSFRVSTLTDTNITVGGGSNGPTDIVFADASAMTADTATIDYGITVVDAAGGEVLVHRVQSFARSKEGAHALTGFVEPSGPINWVRDVDSVTWTPTPTTVDLDVTIKEAGVDVARRAQRVTRTASGLLTSAPVTHKGGDLNTGRITVGASGSGTRAHTLFFDYSFAGLAISVSETVTTQLSGDDGFTALPADFSPGHVGGSDNLVYQLNATTVGGSFDSGEVAIRGTKLEHPDGVLRGMASTDSHVASSFGEGVAGRFFLMWTDTPKATRFTTLTFGGENPNLAGVVYVVGTGWRAFDNSHTLETFTPVATDTIIAVVEAETTSSGLTRIVPLTGSIPPDDTAAAGVVFIDTFERYLDKAEFEQHWGVNDATTGAVNFPANGDFGGSVLRHQGTTDNAYWVKYTKRLIPFDPTALYKVTVRARKTVEETTTPALYFAGLEGVAADGVTRVSRTGTDSTSNQHYVAFSGQDLTVAEGWVTRVVYVKGHASTGENYTASAETPLRPLKLHTDVRYMQPLLIMNYDDLAGHDATHETDFFIIEKVLENQAPKGAVTLDPYFGTVYGEAWEDDPLMDSGGSILSGEYGGGLAIPLPIVVGVDSGSRNTNKFEVVNGEHVVVTASLTRTGVDSGVKTQGSTELHVGVRIFEDDGTVLGVHEVEFENDSNGLAEIIPSAGTYYQYSWGFTVDQAPTTDRMYAQLFAYGFCVSEAGTLGFASVTFDSLVASRAPRPFAGGKFGTGLVPIRPTFNTGARPLLDDGSWGESEYSGHVPASGVGEVVPAGWSAAKTATGRYTVTHNLSLSPTSDLRISAKAVQATNSRGVQVGSYGSNSFTIEILTFGGSFVDDEFFFICQRKH